MKIGLLIGDEHALAQRLMELVNQHESGVTLEMLRLEGTRFDEPIPYRVIIDRISRLVPYYRSFVKFAKVSGAQVINNPYTTESTNILIQNRLATDMGIRTPKVVFTGSDFSLGDGLPRNMVYPFPWKRHVEYLGGFPLIFRLPRPFGRPWLRRVSSIQGLWNLQMGYPGGIELQEFIDYEIYARCICIGQSTSRLFQYEASLGRYGDPTLADELVGKINAYSQRLACKLDMEICSLEWGIIGQEAYLIDLVNVVPDLVESSLGAEGQDWCLHHLAELCIANALG